MLNGETGQIASVLVIADYILSPILIILLLDYINSSIKNLLL